MIDRDEVVSTLQRDGLSLGLRMPPALVAEFTDHLSRRTVYNAHVRAKAEMSAQFALAKTLRWPMFCNDMIDVVTAPHLFELALATYPVARAYFEEEPRLYSMNAFWTQPSDGPQYQDTHSWHRDLDDRKQLVLFLYGTDVFDEAAGAHRYQRGTHQVPDDQLGRHFSDPRPETVATVVGAAGTMFFVDTSGLHMGLRPYRGTRLLAWARWGVSNPPESYNWDKLTPVPRDRLGARYPDNADLREAIKLIVN